MHLISTTLRRVLSGMALLATFLMAACAPEQPADPIRGAPSEANHFIATPEGWEHPMTPWGEPDIRATLDIMQVSLVPLERCGNTYRPGIEPCDMDEVWLPEEEYNELMEEYRNSVDRSRQLAAEGDVGGAMLAGQLDPYIPQRQANLIVDPPNGLLPELTPEGKRQAIEYRSDWALPGQDLAFDGPGDFDSWDRCITRGMPSMMMPYRYNGGFRIHQAPGYVILESEMIHEARVVPTDGRPPIDSDIKQWLGDARGYWDGTTLVVETTNYRNGLEINLPLINLAVRGSPPGNRFPVSDQLKTTERITRLNDDVWLYEITTEDPVILTAPFTVRYPVRHDANYLWPEYACQEDNVIVHNYVETSRYERANPTPEPEQAPVEVSAGVADALAGRWVGRPRIVTIDVDIELEFTRNADGTVNGRLIGTNFGEIDKPLRELSIEERRLTFTLPNIDPWSVQGDLSDDGEIVGIVHAIQGNMPVTFRRTSQ